MMSTQPKHLKQPLKKANFYTLREHFKIHLIMDEKLNKTTVFRSQFDSIIK